MKKTVFKLLAIVILIGVIIAVSVLKSGMSAKRQATQLELIKDEYFRTQDSLLMEQLDDSTRFYIDSIRKLEIYYLGEIDSLDRFYAQRESLSATENADTIELADESLALQIDSTSVEILANFRLRFNRLPKDLTGYEKRVSVHELITELSKEYKLSPDSIKKILNSQS